MSTAKASATLSTAPAVRRQARVSGPPAADRANDREFVRGFERGVAVIKAFNARSPALTVTQVAERTGLTRAVARRYLLTLETLGYVVHTGATFALTPRILEIGFAYLSTISVADVARPVLIRLVEGLQESCSVGMLDRQDVVYVARMNANRIMTTNLAVGSRLPAHATAMGKVLLAYLPPAKLDAFFAMGPLQPLTERTTCDEATLRALVARVRERGWAGNDEESEKGVRTVAAPLFDRSGQVIAAINLSGHSSRVTMRDLRSRYLPVLLQAAREISEALGADPSCFEP